MGRGIASQVLSRRSKTVSAWIRLETVLALMPGASRPETFHALGQADYVQVLCFHATEGLVLVEQFRPVLDVFTLEFPGGLREGTEPPMDTARRDIRGKVAAGAILPASNIALLYLSALHPRVRTICAEFGFASPPWMAG